MALANPDRPARVLVVDDDDSIRDLVGTALDHAGYDVHTVADGYGALRAATASAPDLIVLDVMLPGIDGFEVSARLRAAGDRTPVIFLTAKDASTDVLDGFSRGGDDYLTKPFNLQVLVARVEAVLRRSRPDEGADDGLLVFADVELDEDAHLARRAGDVVPLSPTEFRLLHYFMCNPGVVLSKVQIVDELWPHADLDHPNLVETHVSYLRKKLGLPRLIQTVRGVGYVLRVEP